jgi:hypothetical protein
MENKKAVATNNGSDTCKANSLTKKNHTGKHFIYQCSFCWCELPDNSVRFKGIGACFIHFALAQIFVDSLREHERNYHAKLQSQIDVVAEARNDTTETSD